MKEISHKYSALERKSVLTAQKNLIRSALFIAYPFWMFIQNISFFFVLFYINNLQKINVRTFSINSVLSFNAALLIIGAAASTVGAGINQGKEFFLNSAAILPNYLYWGVLVIILGNSALVVTNLLSLYRIFFWGLICSMITYFFLSPILAGLPLFRTSSPNNFAFILILFSPIAASYLHHTKKNSFYTFLFLLSITLSGFLSGSRSGSLLALAGAFVALSLNSWVRMIITAFFTIFTIVAAPQILDSPAVKSSILQLNERTYSLLYETDETLATDRSYLTRLAMIEKGLNIFSNHPIEGVGVNNFGKVTGEFEFDFEGSEYIESKEDILKEGVSAHNSYISFLAEGGLLLFVPMMLLLIYPIIYFITNFSSIKEYEKAMFVSIIFMSIHAWFISGLLNVYAWFLLGIINSYIKKRKNSLI